MTAIAEPPVPAFEEVAAAKRRIAPFVCNTPVLQFERLDEQLGASVFIKAESFQAIGSFKIRGATNKVLKAIEAGVKPRGLLTASSGNHAQGTAAVSRQIGVPAVILMPDTASPTKVARTRALGAEILHFDPMSQDRTMLITAELAQRPGFLYVPSHDDADIVAGQGTAAVELIGDLQKRRISLDYLFVNCGGGGLAAGAMLAVRALSPDTTLVLVEPQACDDFGRSLSQGRLVRNDPRATTVCDALKAGTPGRIPFAILSAGRPLAMTVSDEEVVEAVRLAFGTLKLAAEPSGVASLAAILQKASLLHGKKVGMILSGGNVTPLQFASMISVEDRAAPQVAN